MLIQDAIAELPPTCAFQGALVLTAPLGKAGDIIKLGSKLRITTRSIPRRRPLEDPYAWACRTWGASPSVVASDPAEWVRIEQLGSRHVARGATLLWGVELSADAALPIGMLKDLVRAAHGRHLAEGVTSANGHTAFLRRTKTRWHLAAAFGEQLTLALDHPGSQG
jgi:hypothetical protein